MSYMLVDGPEKEPITIDELKDYLQVQRDDEHLLLAALIASARVQVEQITRRALLKQRWRFIADCWPIANVLHVDLAPIIALESVSVRNENGEWIPEDDQNFWINDATDPAQIVLKRTGSRPATAVSNAAIAFDFCVGYGNNPEDVPHPLREVVRRSAAHGFHNRSSSPFQADRVAPDLLGELRPYMRLRL